MARLKNPEILQSSKKIFLDTPLIIYWIEEDPRYVAILEPLLSLIHKGQKLAISSTITLLEILVRPIQQKRDDLVIKYKNFLTGEPYLFLATLDAASCESAASFKAKYKFKTPDAIQLALAQTQKSDLFLTNDRQLKQVKEFPVVCLSDF